MGTKTKQTSKQQQQKKTTDGQTVRMIWKLEKFAGYENFNI